MAQKANLQSGEIICSSCSSPVNSNDTVCRACNEPLEGEFRAFMCPSCKIVLHEGSTRCYNCNLKFKSVSKKRETAEDEAFLVRLLKWTDKDLRGEDKSVVVPTIQKSEIERFVKEEAKAEKEESIQGLIDAFKAIIGERRTKWQNIQFGGMDQFKRLRKDERESLEQLENLVQTMEKLFNDLWEKYQVETHEKDGMQKSEDKGSLDEDRAKLNAQLERLKKEKEEFEKKVAKQLEEVKAMEKRLEEKEASIRGLEESRELLESEKNELVQLFKEVKDVLKVVDDLLGKLSDEEIERFAKSDEFKRYETVLERFAV